MRSVAALALPCARHLVAKNTNHNMQRLVYYLRSVYSTVVSLLLARCLCTSVFLCCICVQEESVEAKKSNFIVTHCSPSRSLVYFIHRLLAFVYRMSISLSLYIFSNDLIHIRDCICAIENIHIHTHTARDTRL